MKTKKIVNITLHNLLLAFLAIVWLIPIVWLVVTSFSAYTGMNTSTFFPKEWSVATIRICCFQQIPWHSSLTGLKTPLSSHAVAV
mgnify:CR=1 FL=1